MVRAAPLRERALAAAGAGAVPVRPAERGAAHLHQAHVGCWSRSWAWTRARSWSRWSRRSCGRSRPARRAVRQAPSRATCPYRGLMPYDVDDAEVVLRSRRGRRGVPRPARPRGRRSRGRSVRQRQVVAGACRHRRGAAPRRPDGRDRSPRARTRSTSLPAVPPRGRGPGRGPVRGGLLAVRRPGRADGFLDRAGRARRARAAGRGPAGRPDGRGLRPPRLRPAGRARLYLLGAMGGEDLRAAIEARPGRPVSWSSRGWSTCWCARSRASRARCRCCPTRCARPGCAGRAAR